MQTEVVEETLVQRGLAVDVGGSLLSMLTARWRSLRDAVSKMIASKQERELLLLLDYAATRYGEELLSATNVDDLDDRIDELTDNPDVFLLNALILGTVIQAAPTGTPSSEDFAKVVKATLGEAQSSTIQSADSLLDTWFRVQGEMLAQVPPDAMGDSESFAASAYARLTDSSLPVEYAEALASRLRSEFCLFAMASAVVRNLSVEPWLGRALVDRFINGARGHLRFLASFPEVSVPESVIPQIERLDLNAIASRHQRARAQSDATFARARQNRPSAL